MSKYDELPGKVQDVINIIQSSEAELAVAQKDCQQVQNQKDFILRDIDDLKKDLATLADTKDGVLAQFKAQQGDIDYNKNVLAAKIDEAQQKINDLELNKQDLDQKTQDLQDKLALVNDAKSKADAKMLEADARFNEGTQLVKDAKDLESNSDIPTKLAKAASLQQAADDKMASATSLQTTANDLWHGAQELQTKLSAKEDTLNALQTTLDAQQADLTAQKASLDSQQADIEKQKQDLQYQELRINKLIKDNNIANLLKTGETNA